MNETTKMKKMGAAGASGEGAICGEQATTEKGKSCCRRNAPRTRLFPVGALGHSGISTWTSGIAGISRHLRLCASWCRRRGWAPSTLCQVAGRSCVASRPFPSLSFLVGAESTGPNGHTPDLPGHTIWHEGRDNSTTWTWPSYSNTNSPQPAPCPEVKH